MRIVALVLFMMTAAHGQWVVVSMPVVDTDSGVPAELPVNLDVNGSSANVGSWSYGVCHQTGTQTLQNAVSEMSSWGTPDFESVDLLAEGWTHAVVLSFDTSSTTTLPLGELCVARATYLGGGTVFFCSEALGTPPVENLVIRHDLSGESPLGGSQIGWANGQIRENDAFVRGDCRQDGSINLVDVIRILYITFSGATVNCYDACDANDDGAIDVSDAVYELAYLFNGGPVMPAPGLACGPDANLDSLSCVSYLPGICP